MCLLSSTEHTDVGYTRSGWLRMACSLGIQDSTIWQMRKGAIRSGSRQSIAFISDCVVYFLIVNHLDIEDNCPLLFSPNV